MESNKFRFLDDNLVVIITKIMGNQNILRYLVYLTDDPLSLETTNRLGVIVQQPNIEFDLIDDYIILDDFDENVLESSKCKLFIAPYRGSFKDDGISEDTFSLTFVYPYQYGVLKGQGKTRYNQISYEICKVIDMQDIGVKLPRAESYVKGKINKDYGYMTIFFKVKNASVGKL